jgi:hypothetical protein
MSVNSPCSGASIGVTFVIVGDVSTEIRVKQQIALFSNLLLIFVVVVHAGESATNYKLTMSGRGKGVHCSLMLGSRVLWFSCGAKWFESRLWFSSKAKDLFSRACWFVSHMQEEKVSERVVPSAIARCCVITFR